MNVDDFARDFHEEPGYLDFAAFGPVGRAVAEEQAALTHVLEHARFGATDEFSAQDGRMRRAVSALTGFAPEQIAAQPSTSLGLMHAAFGVTGGIASSAAEFPSIPYAVQRAGRIGDALTSFATTVVP